MLTDRKYTRLDSSVIVDSIRGSSCCRIVVFKNGDLVVSNLGFSPGVLAYEVSYVIGLFGKGKLFSKSSDVDLNSDLFF